MGLDEIIPALYRYSQENYGVTIIDNNKIVARFDLDTENMCNIWPNRSTTPETKQNFVKYINEIIFDYLRNYGTDIDPYSISDAENLFEKIYGQEGKDRTYYCPWQDRSLVPRRVDSDLLRKDN